MTKISGELPQRIRPIAARSRSSPGRPPASDAASRDLHLMNVATAEFLAHGYEGASMSRVARTAQVSPKTVYARYANKDELLLAVVARLTAESGAGVATELAKPSPQLEETMSTIGTALARAWTSEREIGLYRLIIAESVRFPHLATLYRKSTDAFRDMVIVYLEREVERGALRIDDKREACLQFGSLVMGQIREKMLLGDRPSQTEIDRAVASAVKLFLAGYSTR